MSEALFASDLSSSSRLVLQALMWHRNHRTGQCNPRWATLARELGVCRNTVWRALKELRAKGWVVSHRGQRGCSFEVRSKPEPLKSQNQTSEANPEVPNWGCGKSQNGTSDAPASLYEPLELKQSAEPAAADSCSDVEAAASAASTPAAHENATHPEVVLARPVSHPVNPPAGPSQDARDLHRELVAVHPQPGLPERALAEVQKALESSEDPLAVVQSIRENHALWRAYWATLPRERFIPQLWRWLRDGEWRIPPIMRKDADSMRRDRMVAALKADLERSKTYA
jgi:biotin operon repressor